MNAFNRSDPTDQSQATEMLQELLANDKGLSLKPAEAHESPSKPQSNGFSSDSIPSSRGSNSLPHYHFHGLASTQTQSLPHEEDEAIYEGSQKENIAAAERSKDLGLSNPLPILRPPSPHASPYRNAPGKKSHVDSRNGFLSTNKETAKKVPPAVSFQSLRSQSGTGIDTTKQAARHSPYIMTFKPPSRYTPRPRPPSRTSSQDSFARDPSEDPEELFLAKSKQFAIPLSELGRNPVSVDEGPSTSGTSNREMFAYPSSRQQCFTSSPQGRVLVEATPSHSGGSQSQDVSGNLSEPTEATQLLDEPEIRPQSDRPSDVDGNASGDESSEPTSSFGRFLDGIRDPEPDAQPTQPSTQQEVTHMSNPASGLSHGGWNATVAIGTAMTSYPQSTGPRSLISLVRPENQWRYQKYQQPKQIMPSIHDYQSHSNGGHISSSGQETQPSHPMHSSPVPNLASNSHRSRHISLPLRSPVGDAMDIVPDSEPICSDQRHGPLTTDRPSKVPFATKHGSIGNHAAHQEVVMGGLVSERTPCPEDEGDEIDGDDDIPLAAMSRKQSQAKAGPKAVDQRKGKTPQKTVHTALSTKQKVKGKTGGNKDLPEESSMIVTQKLVVVPGPSKRTARSWEVGEVPSSVPEQDIVNAIRETTSTKKDIKSKHRSRSMSAAPKGQRQPSNSIDEEASADELLMPSSDNDDGTELADDDYPDAAPGPSSRKRKRMPSTKALGANNAKTAPKRAKRSNVTPTTRARLRSAVSNTASRAVGGRATRVFALWKQDGHYYSGIVHSIEVGNKYMVKFDDGTSAVLNIDQMRRCQLHVGDDVLIANCTRGCKVVNVNKMANDFVTINVDDDIVDFEIRDIRIAHKTIAYTWGDRILSADTVVATVKPTKLKSSPSPSKLSVTSVPPVRGDRKKVLAKTGLIVTLSATNGNWEKDKENVMNGVKNSGGFVIDDLTTVVQMEGKHSMNNNRWVIGKADAQWIGGIEIERLFLLADDPNQKPKFLIALALGIPCLSTAWLRDSVDCGEEKDWLGYLLPQGYSTILNARPSQQIDVDWGNSVHQLNHIMSNAVASKLFAEKSILCVGPEMVPQPKGKRRAGIDEKSQEAINAVARIILSMGADRVEAVTELGYADNNLSDYDYIVIREASHYQPAFADCTTVHWGWVKDCLIASRYLPLPDWPAECSQEA